MLIFMIYNAWHVYENNTWIKKVRVEIPTWKFVSMLFFRTQTPVCFMLEMHSEMYKNPNKFLEKNLGRKIWSGKKWATHAYL